MAVTPHNLDAAASAHDLIIFKCELEYYMIGSYPGTKESPGTWIPPIENPNWDGMSLAEFLGIVSLLRSDWPIIRDDPNTAPDGYCPELNDYEAPNECTFPYGSYVHVDEVLQNLADLYGCLVCGCGYCNGLARSHPDEGSWNYDVWPSGAWLYYSEDENRYALSRDNETYEKQGAYYAKRAYQDPAGRFCVSSVGKAPAGCNKWTVTDDYYTNYSAGLGFGDIVDGVFQAGIWTSGAGDGLCLNLPKYGTSYNDRIKVTFSCVETA